MSVVRRNIIANFAAKPWVVLMSLIFVPLYVRFMGIESYGLVGIFVSIQSISGFLDMGMSTTLNREMARLSVLPGSDQNMRDFVRTLEIIYWGVGLCIAASVIAMASPIAGYWVHAEKLSPSAIRQAIMIMGGVIAFQWPRRFYAGGLMGLQKQVLLNCIDVGAATIRGVGTVLILWLISPTIQAFLTWQIIVSLFYTLTAATALWKSLPVGGYLPRFRKSLIEGVWRFSAGLTGISIVSLMLTQTDKIILSKLLTLEMFGYYTLATVVAQSLYNFYGPIYNAVFPKFSQLISSSDIIELKFLFHKSCQLLSVIVLPVAVVIAMFSAEVMFLWTGDMTIVLNTRYLVSVLILGTALNGLMHLPAGLQFAAGRTKLILYSDISAVIVLVPMIVISVTYYGAIGAAFSWLALNIAYILFVIHFLFKELLPTEKWRWYLVDVGVPLVSALLVALAWRLIAPEVVSRPYLIGYLAVVSFTTLASSAVMTPYTRSLISDGINRIRLGYQESSTGGK